LKIVQHKQKSRNAPYGRSIPAFLHDEVMKKKWGI